jgi:hypothetical protein
MSMSSRNSFKVMIVTLCSLNFGIYVPEVFAKPIDNYIGVGARAPLQDDLSLILNAKLKIADLGGVSFSGRPAIFLGNSTESRFSLTGEKEISPGWTPFFGGGVATNTDQSGETNLMLSTGVDIQVSEKLVLNIGGNWIFQSDDNDREINVTVNYLF